VSPAGAVVTLLNWRREAVSSLNLSVLLDFDVERAVSVNTTAGDGQPTFVSRPVAGSKGRYVVNVSLPHGLVHGDFLLLFSKKTSVVT
jgi:hypothetical protein